MASTVGIDGDLTNRKRLLLSVGTTESAFVSKDTYQRPQLNLALTWRAPRSNNSVAVHLRRAYSESTI